MKSGNGKIISIRRAFEAERLSGDLNIRVGKNRLALTNLDKVYWSEAGYTKGDLIKYYYEVSSSILPYLKDRPLIMKRYPDGIEGKSFHQHDVNKVPEFVRTVSLEVEDKGNHIVDYIVGGDLPTLLYMANLGAIERHPWHSRTAKLDYPDWIVFDLDPNEGISFKTICKLAVSVKEVLARFKLKGYPKTSGSRGLHVYVPVKPVHTYEEAALIAERLARIVADENSEIATVERSLKKRGQNQIYVDYMQNAKGKSVAAPYSVRPRAGATVSAPLEWSEVEDGAIAPQDFTIKNIGKRLAAKGDLFKSVLNSKQSLRNVLPAIGDNATTAPIKNGRS